MLCQRRLSCFGFAKVRLRLLSDVLVAESHLAILARRSPSTGSRLNPSTLQICGSEFLRLCWSITCVAQSLIADIVNLIVRIMNSSTGNNLRAVVNSNERFTGILLLKL